MSVVSNMNFEVKWSAANPSEIELGYGSQYDAIYDVVA
jgi:hypothetical protein